MRPALYYRGMEPGDEQTVATLVSRIFLETVAPLYPQEGVAEFLRYGANPEAIRLRSQEDHFVLLAEVRGAELCQLVGVIEMRQCRHISLLFVDPPFQRRGIARELMRQCIKRCRMLQPCTDEITVNASPNAVAAYERLGFRATSTQQQVNGISFVPMVLTLAPSSAADQPGTMSTPRPHG
ncbi:MAG: GNAT family N-acetyltransferase [Chloroflexi bacterium]|nr:GNAT family N-acetyltransferase [Chloroflexota bacterium]